MNRKMLLMLSFLLIFFLLCPVAMADVQDPVRIAVIDTGIRKGHAMLNGLNIAQGNNYVFSGEGTDDLIGHGTRIAGLVLGSSDGTLEGLAPDAVLVPLVYYSRYPSGVIKNGGVEAICQAIYDAVDQYNCQVINISSGLKDSDSRLYEAVCYAEEKGVIVVSAVGNDNLTKPDQNYYPAAYETVVGVGAADINSTGTAVFSQRSSNVLLLAPGEGLSVLSIQSGENFETVSGTSYAAAQVTGLAAQLKASYPNMKPADFRKILCRSCLDLEVPGYDVATGWGLVNRNAAVQAADDLSTGVLLPYEDVSYTQWFCGAVRFVYNKALIKGINDQSFDPYGQTTRGMAAAILWRIAGTPTAENIPDTAAFSDVPDGAWYTDAVLWAEKMDIMEGMGDGRFGPNDPITREQLVTILYRYTMLSESGASDTPLKNVTYPDKSEISDWAMDAVAYCQLTGIIKGGNGGEFAPKAMTSRAEMAAFIERVILLTDL